VNKEEAFNQYRPLMLSIAYRMLGSMTDAEDIVQEAFLRWVQAAPEEVQAPKAYLSTIVSRLSIDYLRSAKVKREVYVGQWLPEPILSEQLPDVATSIELHDTLSLAFMVLLESLTPTERAVFLLREVFDYDYSEIAIIVDKSEANCRQMVRRAKQYIAERRPRFPSTPEQQKYITEEFVHSCNTGDLQGLMKLLTSDIRLVSDGGGKVLAAVNPILGPSNVARFLFGILRKAPPGTTIRLGSVNQQPSILAYVDGKIFSVLLLDISADGIQSMQIVINPDKLARLNQMAASN
jgi:RNA polymerase sigma-70 factor (ECF subfamily)